MRKKICVLFLISSFYCFSQEKQSLSFDNIQLQIVLMEVEKVFEVKFSFETEIVENKYFSFSQTASLEDVLKAIEEQVGIVSQRVNERYYTLQKTTSSIICGYIKKGNSTKIIENVSIVNIKKRIGTTTNDQGYFELELNQNEIIEINYLGYKTIVFPKTFFEGKKCPTIYLEEDTFNIDEVIINEYLTSGISKKNGGSIILKPNKLGILPGLIEPDILKSLQLIPGIKSPNETASELYIRGGTPDQNLILFDGIKMYYSGHFFGMISAFNPYIVKEINFYKGGAKARFGNRISGVIDISTKDQFSDKAEGGFGFNLTHVDAYLKTKVTDKLGLVISARRSITDVVNTTTFDNFSKKVFQNTKISNGNRVFEEDVVEEVKDLFYFNDYYAKLIYKPTDKDEISFSNISVKNKLEYEFLIDEFNEKSNDKLNIDNQGLKFLWNHEYKKNFSHHFNAYYSKFNLDYLGKNLYLDAVQNRTIKKNTVKDLQVSFQTNWKLSDFKALNFGYQYSNNMVGYTFGYENVFFQNDNFNDTVSETNNTHTLYTEYEYNDKERWYLNLGLRANHYSLLDQIHFEPRIQVERKINSQFRLNFSAEQNRQSLSKIIEFNTQNFGLENQIWVLANSEDKSILKSHQFSSGATYKKNGWNIDLEGYFKKISGLTSLTNGFTNSANNYSEGESKIVGLELLIKKKINNYRTFLGYSLTQNRSKFETINNGNSFRGNQDIRNSLSWSHSYKLKDFDFSLGWSIRTGIPFTNADGLVTNDQVTSINYGKVNAKRLPNYHRLDFSTYYKFLFTKNEKWKGKVGFSLLNAYNQKNILCRNYNIRFDSNGEEVLQILDKYSLGVTPNFVFRVEF